MRTLKLTIAYDGMPFAGWQRQSEARSVQGCVEAALAELEGRAVIAHGAGRTDAGVHALGQVASACVTFSHGPDTVLRALNARLPIEVRVIAVEEVDSEFHARFSARAKTYRYLLANDAIGSPFLVNRAWHIRQPLDRVSMAAAAATLVGTHDFAAFRSAGGHVSTTVRTITRSEFKDAPLEMLCGATCSLLAFEITGDGFLRHMVRAVVGTLVEIGRGWRAPDAMIALLNRGDRGKAGATAPPSGLYLVRVDY